MGQVLGVRFLEETSFVFGLAIRVVVLNGKQPVSWRAALRPWVTVVMTTMPTHAVATAGRAFGAQGRTTLLTGAWLSPIRYLVEVSAGGAHQDVSRVTRVLCKDISREEVDVLTAPPASRNLDPEEVLHGDVDIAVKGTIGEIKAANGGSEIFQ
jgi:hypothetical protein